MWCFYRKLALSSTAQRQADGKFHINTLTATSQGWTNYQRTQIRELLHSFGIGKLLPLFLFPENSGRQLCCFPHHTSQLDVIEAVSGFILVYSALIHFTKWVQHCIHWNNEKKMLKMYVKCQHMRKNKVPIIMVSIFQIIQLPAKHFSTSSWYFRLLKFKFPVAMEKLFCFT